MYWLLQRACTLLFALISCVYMAPPGVLDGPATGADDTSPLKPTIVGGGRKRRNRKSAAANLMMMGGLDGGGAPVSGAVATVNAGGKANLSRRQIGANWQQSGIAVMRPDPRLPTPPMKLPTTKQGIRITKHIAMDCEMVGVGYAGKKHMLARVSIVNQMCEVLMDRYVRPLEPVVDYRTEVSGIRPRDIARGDDFAQVQQDVQRLLDKRILVGHAVYNDLKVLGLEHPHRCVRDTSSYRPLINRITGGATPSLKTLARCVLNVEIQGGEHSSVEDARAAMRIYNRYQEEWERAVRRRNN